MTGRASRVEAQVRVIQYHVRGLQPDAEIDLAFKPKLLNSLCDRQRGLTLQKS